MDKKKSVIKIILFVLLIILAAGLRLLYINTSFWYDEACSWFTASKAFPMGIIDNLLHLDLQHTPLYFFILHFWMKIFGDSEVAIRSLSVIFAIGTVPLVYTAAKKLTSVKNAIIAVLLAAVSPILVFFSTEARMYPLVIFMVILSVNYLIDFEQKNDIKSLIKLVFANLLIPYTLVGGILYNVSLVICYGSYLFKDNREKFFRYIKAAVVEFILLIPYFVLIGYYAKMRSLFVVRHEGPLAFFNIIDLIRNFFGIILTPNPYWPELNPYVVTLVFTLLVIVPCVYFVYGLVQGCKLSEKFLKILYFIFFLNFGLAVVCSYFEISIFTVRYYLYLLPPLFILAVIGLSKKLSFKHLGIFVSIFIASAVSYNIQQLDVMYHLKFFAFEAVKAEADELKLGKDDVIIMPLGSDAPYYFRKPGSSKVFNFDFHKEVRNPYNSNYYDAEQQKLMDKPAKYGVIYDAVFANTYFSENHFKYFTKEVNSYVPSGRYVLVALYGGDVNAIVQLRDLRKSISSVQDIKDRCLDIMLQKYIYDMGELLNLDFDLMNSYTKDNYTYFIFKKR